MTEPAPSTPDLLMAMLSGLPSRVLADAERIASARERREAHYRDMRETRAAENDARLAIIEKGASEESVLTG